MTDAPLDPALAAELRAALLWHIEAGADEALAAEPIDRAAVAAPAANAVASRSAAPGAPAVQNAPPAQDAPLTRAAAAAAQARDLTELKAALDAFDGSALKAGARQAVTGDGRPHAHVMIIGEAPGAEEDRAGQPFVGRSGKLLDRMMAEIGLHRRSDDPAAAFYVTNVLPYRPLANRTPDDQEAAILLPFLHRQIALVRPRILLCLGNVPAKHVMGAGQGITRYRGTWTDALIADPAAPSDATAIPALASFHPAFLLRSPEMKRLAWRDLLDLKRRLDAQASHG